jgi:hypothetical protein
LTLVLAVLVHSEDGPADYVGKDEWYDESRHKNGNQTNAGSGGAANHDGKEMYEWGKLIKSARLLMMARVMMEEKVRGRSRQRAAC